MMMIDFKTDHMLFLCI